MIVISVNFEEEIYYTLTRFKNRMAELKNEGYFIIADDGALGVSRRPVKGKPANANFAKVFTCNRKIYKECKENTYYGC